ncbi:MAG: hypothetical protein V4733_11255 [Verrucomicrobiota bacterium]
MKETFTVIGLVILAVALRHSRRKLVRKLGALVFLAATFLAFYFCSGGMVCIGLTGVALWFFLPWIELLTRIRRMKLPLENRLHHESPPASSLIPNAPEAAVAMDDDGFDHVSDCAWRWDGMKQFFRLYWNPEERAVAAICLCEQSDVTFAFISISSTTACGKILRTTNFPFAPTLACPPDVLWNHLPCDCNCFHRILASHREWLEKKAISHHDLRVPDSETVEATIENEMSRLVRHNLGLGIIRLTGDGHFRYSPRGMFFLWGQFVKDMIRFC